MDQGSSAVVVSIDQTRTTVETAELLPVRVIGYSRRVSLEAYKRGPFLCGNGTSAMTPDQPEVSYRFRYRSRVQLAMSTRYDELKKKIPRRWFGPRV